jgi:hypothetical protein
MFHQVAAHIVAMAKTGCHQALSGSASSCQMQVWMTSFGVSLIR